MKIKKMFFLMGLMTVIFSFSVQSLMADATVFKAVKGGLNKTSRVPKWTIIVHFAVDNNIDSEWESSSNPDQHFIEKYITTLKDIEKKDINNDVEIFLMLDSVNSAGNYQDGYYILTGDGEIAEDLAVTKNEINSGSVQETKDFIDWVFERKQGSRILYSVFDHGSGFDDTNKEGLYGSSLAKKRGIGFDESHDDCLSHYELGVITGYLKDKKGSKVDLFYTLACLMGGMELAEMVDGNVEYLVSSEDLFPASNWSYEALEEIVNNPDISSRNLGIKFCDSAYRYLGFWGSFRSFTLSVVDPSKSSALRAAIGNYALEAVSYIGDSPERAESFSKAAQSYSMAGLVYGNDFYMTDIGAYLKAVKGTRGMGEGVKIQADYVKEALEDCVVYERAFLRSKATGLSIFHHIWNSSYYYDPDVYAEVLELGLNDPWTAYMKKIMSLMPVKADAYESKKGDDGIKDAGSADFGVSQYHTIHTYKDTDYIKIDLVEGESIKIKTSPGPAEDSAGFSLALDVYIVENMLADSDASVLPGYYPELDFTAKDTGTYYIKLGTVGKNIGDYELIITSLIGDRYEDDGSFEKAGTMEPGDKPQKHTFHTPNDKDYVKLDLSKVNVDSTITIETSRFIRNTDTYMVLYDENKIRLKVDDDGGVDRFSKITFLCEKPGIYYIYLYETGLDETGDYKLELTAEGGSIPTPPPAIDKDEFEPDNEMDSAQTVDLTTGLLKQAHTLDTSEDIDYFKVILKKKQKIHIETHKNRIETDTIVQIVNSDGKQVAYNADGGEGAYSLLEWSAPSAGTWYIRVKTYPDDSQGDYLIDIKDITPPAVEVDPYENDNVKENAREIFPGIVQERSICDLGDVDWIKFEIKKGDAVRISTTSEWGDVFEHYLYLELYDSKNDLKASAEDYGGELTLDWECDKTGTFYIKVYEYYETEVLDYKLLVVKK